MGASGWLEERGIVSQRHRCLYVPVPKVASTTLLAVLYEVEGLPIPERLPGVPDRHSRGPGSLPGLASMSDAERQVVLSGASYLRCSVVRNPYTRIVAAWFNKIWLRAGDSIATQEAISAWCGRLPSDPPTFEQFVDWVCSTENPETCDPHWRPMVRLLAIDEVNYNLIGRAEALVPSLLPLAHRVGLAAEEFAQLLERSAANRSVPFDRTHLYNERTAARVAEFYSEDFRRFGYPLDSWQDIVAQPPPTAAQIEAGAVRVLRNRAVVTAQLNKSASEAWRRVFSSTTSTD